MSVYLVYRAPYNQENCKYVKRFSNPDLLHWIHHLWDIVFSCKNDEELTERLTEYWGIEIFGFWFYEIFEEKIGEPATIGKAAEVFSSKGYITDMKTNERNFIQMLTDDDELGLAVYLFDHTYLEEKPEFAAYLANPDFELPLSKQVKSSELRSKGVSLFFESLISAGQLDYLVPPVFIPEIRLNDLSQYLATCTPPKEWDIELMALRVCSVNLEGKVNSFDEMINEFTQYKQPFWEEFIGVELIGESDKLEYKNREKAFLWGKDIVEVKKIIAEKYKTFTKNPRIEARKLHGGVHKIQRGSNVFQIGLFYQNWGTATTPYPLYSHWIFFDNTWAEEFPYLANSIKQYFTHWDALQ